MSEEKYKIELSEEQLRLVADCLEDCSRFASGQLELSKTLTAVYKELDFEEYIQRRDEADILLSRLKEVLFPELSRNGSKGYDGSEFIGNTYQIYRTILYTLATDKNWNNVYSSPALPSGNLGTVKVSKITR